MTKEIQRRPVDTLKGMMNNPAVQEQFSNALGENRNLFVASIIDMFTSEKSLQKCNPAGVVSEALKAATLQLPINKSLGYAYIVPYKGQAQFQLGYKGMIQLAQRSGVYRYINAGPVYEGELVKTDKLTGEIDLSGERKSNEVIGYFSYIETVNGFKKSLFMTKDEMTAHAERFSKAFKFGPWKTDFDAMSRKTMLRRLLSTYGQMTVEMAGGIASDADQIFESEQHEPVNIINPEDELNKRFSGGETIDNDTGEIKPESEGKKPTRARTRPKVVEKFKAEIDHIENSLHLSRWRQKHFKRMVRELPAEKDQKTVLDYAEKKYQELKNKERDDKNEPPVPGDPFVDGGLKVKTSKCEPEFIACPNGNGNVPADYCNTECDSRPGCPAWPNNDNSKLTIDI